MRVFAVTSQRVCRIIGAALLCALAVWPVGAQPGSTTSYVYDNNGRLRAVIAPDGQAAVYDYDPAGNITAIRRLTAESFELLTFFPDVGKEGDLVTFRGLGLETVTTVSFNGAAARIVRAEPTRIIAEVPAAVTTGPITLSSPRGTLTTALPFIVRGVVIDPRAASLSLGQSRQFTARVLPEGSDQAVTWSVNGVVGGNSSFGTITANGEYTAPRTLFSMITVRATSVADPELVDEALVMVGVMADPTRLTGFAAAYLSVRREDPPTPPLMIAAVSTGVSVVRLPPPDLPPVGAAISAAVAVGRAANVPMPEVAAAISAIVSIARADSVVSAAPVAAISAAVAVGRDQQPTLSLPAGAFSAVVTASKAPLLATTTPATIARGASNISLTISGVNLHGAAALRFINAAGAADANLTAANLIVSTDGRTLTATLSVNAAAAPGRRLVVVTTPGGHSQVYQIGSNPGQNTIEVIP